jgi:FAD/FMN-containing dehydrogenase
MTTIQQADRGTPVLRAIPPQAVAALQAAVTGPVLRPDDPGFAAETATFNLAVPQHPLLAIGATSVADVQAAVKFAAEYSRPIAVLATGHGAVASASGAILINTSRMTGLSIDEEWMTARVEAGVRWQQVIDEAAEVGLAPMAGSSPQIGVIGYHLGGGLSPVLGRPLGFAADYVRALDVVTADGRLRQVTAEQEPELFWALRGGQGNFGVVTALEFDLFPVRVIYGGGMYYDGRDAIAVLEAYRSWLPQLPDQLSSSILLLRTPDLPSLPAPMRGRLVVHLRVAYLGAATYGEELLAPMRAAAPVLLDHVGEMPFSSMADIHNDPIEPFASYERTALLWDLTEEVVDRLIEVAGPDAEPTLTAVELRHLGGALERTPRVENAIDNRDAGFSVIATVAAGPEQARTARTALDRLVEALRPWSTGGTYLNFMSAADTPAGRVRAAYRPGTYQRLLSAKQTYDPHNIFRINHNLQTGV